MNFNQIDETDAFAQMKDKLRRAGLRPTQQRLSLSKLLYKDGDRHVSAEQLFEECQSAGLKVSLATVYNSLKQFEKAGLLKEIALEGARSLYDTNVSNHCHFYHEETGQLYDVPSGQVQLGNLPTPPEGMEIIGVDMVLRVRDKRRK